MNDLEELDKLFNKYIVDESAKSIEELMEYTGRSREYAARTMREAVESGKWETVKKHAKSGRLVLAYRLKTQTPQ